MRQIIAIISLALAVNTVNAEVYLLRPENGAGNGKAVPGNLPYLLGRNKIMEEPVTVNGMKMTLNVSLVNDSLASCFKLLQREYAEAQFRANADSLLVKVKNGEGSIRLLLIKLGDGYPAVQFSLEVPGAIPKKFEWPKELPLIPGAIPLQYMAFTGRGTTYGVFSTEMSPGDALQLFAGAAKSSGWFPSSPGALASGDNGHVFIRNSPPGLMAVNFSSGKGMVFLRPLK